MNKCVILGAGGHARVLIDVMLEAERYDIACVLDSDSGLWGKEIYGIPITGGDELLAGMMAKGISHFVVAVGSIKDNEPRARLYRLAIDRGLAPLTITAVTATVSKNAILKPGCQILSRVVVNPGAIIGDNSIINTGAIIEHDCLIGKHVHVAPGAVLSGMVQVGDLAHIGTGSSIKQGVRIGDGAVVGVGAAVISDVAKGQVVAGVPAKIIKTV